MATWGEFAKTEPGFAAFASDRMQGRIVYQATLRLDGGPRVHPVSPWLAAGLLCVSFRETSPKIRDVARDPRYALDTASPWEDHSGDYGEFMVLGSLEEAPRPTRQWWPAPATRPMGSSTTHARSWRRWRPSTPTMRCPYIDAGRAPVGAAV